MKWMQQKLLERMVKGGKLPMDPRMVMESLKNPDPQTRAAMQMGMALGERIRKEMPLEQQKAIQEAFMAGDMTKIDQLMPPELKEMIEKFAKQAQNMQGAPKKEEEDPKRNS